MKVIVLKRQTLSDIALEVYGDISGLPGIARANGLSLTEQLEVGQTLQCPDVVYDTYLQNYVRKNGIKPATAYDGAEGDIPQRVFTEQFTLEFE